MTYIDCNQNEVEIDVHYRAYGWLYYLGVALFALSSWTLANIFLLTATTLGLSLEATKLKSERNKLLEDS